MQKKYIVRLTNEEQERKPGSSTPDALEHHARRQSVWTEYANDRIQKFGENVGSSRSKLWRLWSLKR